MGDRQRSEECDEKPSPYPTMDDWLALSDRVWANEIARKRLRAAALPDKRPERAIAARQLRLR